MNPIKTFREYRGLTQAKLAKLTNLSVVMIKNLESGETKESLKSLKAIAKALNWKCQIFSVKVKSIR